MRIAHVITRLIVGGAQENTVASIIGLRSQPNFSVELITGPTVGAEGNLHPLLDQHHLVPILIPSLVRPLHPPKDLLAFAQLTRHFRRSKPDLVHTHSGKAGFLGRLAAHRARVPLIVHTIHGPSFGSFQGALANLVLTAAERWAGRVTNQFVSVADAMTRHYLRAGIGKPEQFVTIRSGFDLEPFSSARPDPALRLQLGLSPNDFVVGTIARLAPLKGHHELLQMLPALTRGCPTIKLLWVGDGSLRHELHQQLHQRGLADRVRFAGLVSPAEMARYVALMDVVIHLSRREGLARALPQALAAGRPVVAYDCDGAQEVCRDGVTGFLIAPGDLDTAIRRLLELTRTPAMRTTMGQRGLDLIRAEFPVDRMVQSLHALYLQLQASLSTAQRGAGKPMTKRWQ